MSAPTAAETAPAEPTRTDEPAADEVSTAERAEQGGAAIGADAAHRRAPEAVPLPVAVLGAGVVAQAVGLAARLAAGTGTSLHDGGGALVAVGWVAVFAGLLWLLRRPVVAALAVAAVIALGAGVALGRSGANEPGTGTPTTAPTAVTTQAPSTTAGSIPPGPTTTIDPATPTTRSIGQILADQGAGSNSPPPSIPGASFPVEGGRVDQAGPAPWAGGAAPVMPIAPPTEPLASTTTVTTTPAAAEPTSTSGAGS